MLTVRGDELEAVTTALRSLPRAIRRDIDKANRDDLKPIWQGEVTSRLASPMDRLLLGAGVSVKAGAPPVVRAATSTRGIGKARRLKPADHWGAWEFGSNQRGTYTTYSRKSKHGGTHKVRRRATVQIPARSKTRVIYKAFGATTPQMAERYVEGVARLINEAAEGIAN